MKENISYQKLPRSFYLDDTVNVAKKLIGKLLVREIGGETCRHHLRNRGLYRIF